MIVQNFNSLWPFRKRFGRRVANFDVRLAQSQPRYDLPVSPEIIEQLKQHQLRIRVRVDPQFNRFALPAKLKQAETLAADLFASATDLVQPIRECRIVSR